MKKYRSKISRRSSKKSFRRSSRVHRKNAQGRPMRGGIRL